MQVPPAQQPVQFEELQEPDEPPPAPPPPAPPPEPPLPHLKLELQLMLVLVQSTHELPAVPQVVLLPLFGVFTHVPLLQQPEQLAELQPPPTLLLLHEGIIAARKPIAAPSARALSFIVCYLSS
jgi:hypothetical protein